MHTPIPWARSLRRAMKASLLALTAPFWNTLAHAQELEPTDAAVFSLELVNRARGAEGLERLEIADAPMMAARRHAEAMARQDFYSHKGLNGSTPRSRFLQVGGSGSALVAENIARCTGCAEPIDERAVRNLHRGWMESPGHRGNILREGMTGYGFAAAYTEGGDGRSRRYAVEVFAGAGASGGKVLAPGDASARLADLLVADRSTPIAASVVLTDAAARALPADGSLDAVPPMDGLVPADARYRTLRMLMARCRGCGATLTTADLDRFADQWRSDDATRRILASSSVNEIGAAVAADGDGGKLIVAILGGGRSE